MRRVIIFCVGVSLAATAIAQRAEPIDSLAPAVQAAVNRGALLYLYDKAAWHGTDDLNARFAELKPLVGGYVVTGKQADVELTFYDKAQSKALYRAKFANQKLSESGPPAADRVALTVAERRLIAARATALKAFGDAKVRTCAKGMPNVALLPAELPTDPVRAYLMTPRTSMKSLPMGGHFEVDVLADGKPGKVRAFTQSCLELSTAGVGKGKPKAMMLSHLLDPSPTEIHVFSSLSARVPVYVLTMANKTLWAVTGTSVRIVPVGMNSQK